MKKKKLLTKDKIKKNNIILAIPSSGLHSNGFSLVRSILKKRKNFSLTSQLKKELIKPTKIYVKEINNLNKIKLINGCANITGGGLIDNLVRIVPDKLCLNIDLSKIKIKQIFKWLKNNNINDSEMLKTFNCGVGFCLIINKKNIKKIKKHFSKKFQPYVIGKISKNSAKVKFNGKIKW